MARDIEEFLRRAAERRAQQQKKKQRPASPPPPPQEKPRRLVIGDDQVEVVKPRLVQQQDLRSESVDEHVRRHISSQDVVQHAQSIGRHAEGLAERIQQTDERLESRLHQKFDHQIGKLDKDVHAEVETAASVTVDEVSAISSSIIRSLTNPQSVQQAIIISEVLRRPDFDDDE